MAQALLILLMVSQGTAVDVWTGGDDELTQRFAHALRAATHHIPPSDNDRQIRALVEQIEPLRSRRLRVVVSFERNGRHIGTSRCTAREDDLSLCVARASAAAKRLLVKIR
ncbi:hypothetical protein FHS94_000984 [Sphingomonas aerophila]|jgi:hypothetical protein|uniref:Uncharacterized protein n=1 Tax=Sphingomonas aerophila TaxID=1344948 RepID=A0A7W9BC82_9SPHN|nr:hypothetical protein [Sphingomonas aerophila]